MAASDLASCASVAVS